MVWRLGEARSGLVREPQEPGVQILIQNNPNYQRAGPVVKA